MSKIEELRKASDRQYERGTFKDNPMGVSDSALCLSEMSMMYLSNHRLKHKLSKIVGHVKDICGTTRRPMFKVWVHDKTDIQQYWADIVTGTLYTLTGECLSSEKRKVVKWVRYRESEWKKIKLEGRTEAQESWNEGV